MNFLKASKVDYRVNERFLEVAYSEKFDNLVRWFTNSPVIFSSLSYDKRVAKYLQSPAEEDSIVSSLKTNLKAMLDEFPESDDADSHSQEEDDDLPALDGVSFESDDKGEYGNDYHNEGVVQEEMSDTQSEAMGDVDLDDGIEVDMDGTNNQENFRKSETCGKTKKGDVIDKRLVVGAERSSNYAKVPSKQECLPATQPDDVPHVPLIPVDPLFECFGQHHYPYNVVRPYCLPVDFLHPYTPLIPTLQTPQYVLHWLQFMPSVANMEVLTNELTSNLNPNASPFVSRKVANSTPSVDVVPDSTSSNQCEDPLDQKEDTSTDNHDCTPSSDTALASPSSYVRSPLQLSTSTPLPSPKSLILDLDTVITSSPHQKEEDQSRNDVIPCEALSAYIWETWNQICTENAIWFELTQKEEDSTSQSPSGLY